MNKIQDKHIKYTLDRMHREANSELPTIAKGLAKGIFRKLRPEDMKDAYIAVSRSQGEAIYDLLLRNKAKHIVEFGTSFGISTLYLAAAAKANHGKVITTELLPEKAKIAQRNFDEAGITEWVDLRVGNAMETLKDIEEDIDFLLLDGWNDLYLPLVKLLEPKFKKGTLIYADNASFKSAKPYLEYLRGNPSKYKTKRLSDHKGGSELSEHIFDKSSLR